MAHKYSSKYILNKGIWLFFFLLIFEGSLRKWIVPGLSAPLLVVRDPIAIFLLAYGWVNGHLKLNGYILAMGFVGIAGFISAIVVGHGDITVAAYGLRILCIHFPLMFLIGRVFDKTDVIKIGRVLLWITLPMILLIVLQFISPQSAWVNVGVGGTGSAGFSGALGYFRPSGTFSFTNGNTLLWGLVAPFLFYFWLAPKKELNPTLLWLASAALILAIPLSISRTLLFRVFLTVAFSFFIFFKKPALLKRFVLVAAALLLVTFALFQTGLGTTGAEVFTARFERAAATEGGVVEGTIIGRFFGGLINPIANAMEVPLLGYGLGLGTNAGAVMVSGERLFLIAEGEWGRIMGEMGALLGFLVIGTRVALVSHMTILSYRHLKKANLLPWLLLSFGAVTILTTQWGQPTSLGFSTLIGGLVLASMRLPDTQNSK